MSPPRPRILMTTDAVGGVWTYAASLARNLCRHGHEVTLVTMGPAPRREQVESLTGIAGLSLEATGLALEWIDAEGLDMPLARETLLRLAERAQPDLIHLNSFREATFDFGVPVLAVAHSCVGSWWQACGPGQMEPRWRAYLRNVAAGLNAADRWAAPTMAYRDWIEHFYRPRTRGETVWNGADPASADTKQRSILAAGRLWDDAKNLHSLAKVAADVHWPISVAGSLQVAGGAQAAEAGGLRVLGELAHDDLLMHMRRAGIFVAPALYEPFGLSILEAASRGCALALSDIPTLRELWDGAALFVEPTDIVALRNALNTLCDDDDLRARFAAAARYRARRYTLEAMVGNYRRIYGELIERAPAARNRASQAEMRA